MENSSNIADCGCISPDLFCSRSKTVCLNNSVLTDEITPIFILLSTVSRDFLLKIHFNPSACHGHQGIFLYFGLFFVITFMIFWTG